MISARLRAGPNMVAVLMMAVSTIGLLVSMRRSRGRSRHDRTPSLRGTDNTARRYVRHECHEQHAENYTAMRCTPHSHGILDRRRNRAIV